MSNSSIATGQEGNSPPSGLPNSAASLSDQTGYQQALTDFALTALLHRLNTYCHTTGISLESQDVETLAARLIQVLATSLTDNLLASYLEAIRYHPLETLSNLSSLLSPASLPLPTCFPDVAMPRFLYGDHLRWISDGTATDWGVVIGRFYSFAPHRCCWAWCYLIWINADSPSSAWVNADIAWEDDLEPMEAEATR